MKKYRIFVICSFLMLICMFFTSCAANSAHKAEESETTKSVVNNSPESSVDDKPWKTEYDRKLHDFYIEYNERYSSPQKIYYDIYDLDGDDFPELIISEGDFHAAGCRIYSYDNSKLIEVGKLGEWGTFSFYPQSRLFLFAWTNQGHYIAKWYEIENHKLNLLYSYGFWWKEKDLKQYEINGKSASEEEYNEYLEDHSDKRPGKDEERIELGKGSVYQE